MKTALHLLSHAIFWVWNLAFIGVVYFWILPEIGLDILREAQTGAIPPAFLLSIIGILVIPILCTLIGGWRLRKHPILLMRLFYGVEAPLFGLCLLRLFLIRETTAASAHILVTLLFSIAIFAIETLVGYAAYRRSLAWVQMVGHSLILLTGLYAGALLLMYTVPALCVMVYGFFTSFFQLYWLQGLSSFWRRPWELILIGLFCSSCLVFVSMPYVMVNFYIRSWHRIRTAFSKQYGEGRSWTTTGIVFGLSCVLFGLFQFQPQAQAFDLLATSPETPQARQSLLQSSETIRRGLVNAYLSRYRYLSPAKDSNQLREMYKAVFNMPQSGAQIFQTIHNGLLSPFLYRGENQDIEKARDLYAEFFDAPIQKAERSTIRQALEATANRDEVQAGLLNLDQKVVRLAEQTVTVKEQGDWAEVEIYEEYENKTTTDQEIFYSFSLPESAVISGLWLAEEKNSLRFPFVVSPRGAAQQVYKDEVERANDALAEDPALLEQVGPRQYRLRVFPIPAAMDRDKPGELHLWMTYQVMQQAGRWPLPQLSEKRNIFWTDKTIHQRLGNPITLDEDQWFEAAIPAKQKTSPQAHQVEFAEGYTVTVSPASQQQVALPQGKKIAIVLDSSYSMGQQMEAVKEAVKQLQQLAKSNTLDLYLTTATGQVPTPTHDFKVFEQAVFYGSLQPSEMLQQFEQQRQGQVYDAVLLLTDQGSYELAETTASEFPAITSPLWLVHLGGHLPAAYEDSLLQTLQTSGGSVVTDVTTAVQRLNAAATGDVLDGYTWTVTSPVNSQNTSQTPNSVAKTSLSEQGDIDFVTLAARQLISHQSRRVDMTVLANLDGVHAIAKRTGIVTPYSSMLVLVNDRQRELLRQAESDAARFDREVEDGQDDLTNPNNPLNSVSVPEPMMMMGLSTMALTLIWLKRKQGH